MHFINATDACYLSGEQIDSIISNKFELDCANIVLTQQNGTPPLVFRGPGSIVLDESGKFNLKLYVKLDDMEKAWSWPERDNIPGKIIPEDRYFSLKAVDISGVEWVSENIMLSKDVSFPTNSMIIKAELVEIRNNASFCSSQVNFNNCLKMFIPGQYKIPCNKTVDLPKGGWSLSKLEFLACGINFELEQRDSCLFINASYDSKAQWDNIEYLIKEALSILIGDFVRPKIVYNYCGNVKSLRIISLKRDSCCSGSFPTPFRNRINEVDSFVSFYEKYLSARKRCSTDLIGFWHKIFKAWQSGVDNSSLPLTVAIEGMLKTYFSDYMQPDRTVLEQINNARIVVNALAVDSNVKGGILNCLGGMKKLSPAATFRKMAHQGFFPEEWVDVWSKLRNRSVHADKLDKDKVEVQLSVDRIFTCFTFYYRLLFLVIEYEGKQTNYSKEGWPEENFMIPKIIQDEST